jgi:hypothetical protein
MAAAQADAPAAPRPSHAVQERIKRFEDFYKFYQQEHSKPTTRVLHVLGTSLFALQAVAAAVTRRPPLLLSGVISAYGLAWVSHFFVEHNRPATFK